MSYVVEVNECRVFATQLGEAWWHTFVAAHAARLTRVVMSVAGDLVHVECANKEHADLLRAHMTDYGGLPTSAVKTRRV